MSDPAYKPIESSESSESDDSHVSTEPAIIPPVKVSCGVCGGKFVTVFVFVAQTSSSRSKRWPRAHWPSWPSQETPQTEATRKEAGRGKGPTSTCDTSSSEAHLPYPGSRLLAGLVEAKSEMCTV